MSALHKVGLLLEISELLETAATLALDAKEHVIWEQIVDVQTTVNEALDSGD